MVRSRRPPRKTQQTEQRPPKGREKVPAKSDVRAVPTPQNALTRQASRLLGVCPPWPDNARGREDCGQIKGGSGKWNDLPCSKTLHYICKISPCEYGWYFLIDSCIKYFDNPLSWNEAEQVCYSHNGGTLASFHSWPDLSASSTASALATCAPLAVVKSELSVVDASSI